MAILFWKFPVECEVLDGAFTLGFCISKVDCAELLNPNTIQAVGILRV